MIELADETRDRLLKGIQACCLDELDQQIGLLKAQLILQRMMQLIGTVAYNQALADAQAYLNSKLIDMELDLRQLSSDAGPDDPPAD